MRYKYYIPFCLLLICFGIYSCKPKKNYIVKVKLVKLTEDNMFDRDMITDYLFDAEELKVDSLKNKSEHLFLLGIDQYKNKKNPEAAISLFKKSILLFPDAKTYYELGDALLEGQEKHPEKDRLKMAVNAYKTSADLNFQPLSNLYYNMACANNLIGEGYGDALDNIRTAFVNGFTDTTRLKEDTRINLLVSIDGYKDLVFSLKNKVTKKSGESFFDTYMNAFPVVSQPFKIDTNKVAMEDYKQSISYDFVKFIPEMENVQFGRMVSNDFFYVAKVAETANYIALIYSSDSYFGSDMQPVNVNLVTYDKVGNIISNRLFAGQFSVEKIRSGKIENNIITLQDYKRTWKYKTDSIAIYDNRVTKYELLQTATFMINDSGRIIKQSVPDKFNDSSAVASTDTRK